MIKFIYEHPDYLFLLFLSLFFIYKVLLHIVKYEDDSEDGDDDDDGGIPVEDPILDLPPGVSLPKDKDLQPVH